MVAGDEENFPKQEGLESKSLLEEGKELLRENITSFDGGNEYYDIDGDTCKLEDLLREEFEDKLDSFFYKCSKNPGLLRVELQEKDDSLKKIIICVGQDIFIQEWDQEYDIPYSGTGMKSRYNIFNESGVRNNIDGQIESNREKISELESINNNLDNFQKSTFSMPPKKN